MPQGEPVHPADLAPLVGTLVLAVLKELGRVPRGFPRRANICPSPVMLGGTSMVWSGHDGEFDRVLAAAYLCGTLSLSLRPEQ